MYVHGIHLAPFPFNIDFCTAAVEGQKHNDSNKHFQPPLGPQLSRSRHQLIKLNNLEYFNVALVTRNSQYIKQILLFVEGFLDYYLF